MATARNVNALDDVDGPEDLDNFVKELMDNMVRHFLTLFQCGGMSVVLTLTRLFVHLSHYTASSLRFKLVANSIQSFERYYS